MTALCMSVQQRHTLRLLLQTFAPAVYDNESAAAVLESALQRLPARRRDNLLLFLRVLDTPLPGLILVQRFTPFSKLDGGERERLLFALARSHVPQLRAGFQAFKRLCLFAAYAAVDAQGGNPLWREIGYPGPRADTPAADALARIKRASAATHPLAVDTNLNDMDCDAVVAGSGA